MKKKVLIAVLASLAVLVGGFGLAYAMGTFQALEQGVRQAGTGQAAKLTMQVEAGLADPNSTLLPDPISCNFTPCPGGALSFSITNNNDVPIRVLKIGGAMVPCGGFTCLAVNSNKNTDGTYVQHGPDGGQLSTGTCSTYASYQAPANYDNWPTIAPHSTLQVNGTDNNALGTGMIHLQNNTPNNCQGALFTIGLVVQATEATAPPGANNL
jgi:hypothetical protein